MLAGLVSSGATHHQPAGSRLLAILTAVMLIATACGNPATTRSPSPSTGASPSSPVAGATGAPGATSSTGPGPSSTGPGPSSTDTPTGDWAPVTLTASATPVATLEATKHGEHAVAVDTAFRLRSLDGISPATLADRSRSSRPSRSRDPRPRVTASRSRRRRRFAGDWPIDSRLVALMDPPRPRGRSSPRPLPGSGPGG
jgi:hypothetical protein